MDEASLRERLDLAEADVARMRMLICRQRDHIAAVENRCKSAAEARALLADYEKMLALHKSDRDWVKAQLANIRQA
jgi:hypothetical protein